MAIKKRNLPKPKPTKSPKRKRKFAGSLSKAEMLFKIANQKKNKDPGKPKRKPKKTKSGVKYTMPTRAK